MKRLIVLSSILLSASLGFSQSAQETSLANILKTMHDKYAPDRRTAVFDVTAEMSGPNLILRGEVDDADARQQVVQAIRASSKAAVIDSIRTLPDPSLGSKTFGIVTVSVGNVRTKPGDAEELSTQVLMGMVVRVLKKHGGYYYVQSSDHYLGWLDDDAFALTDRAEVDAWAAARKVIVTGYFGVVRENAGDDAQPVSDALIGNLFKFLDASNGWTHVAIADGRTGYIASSLVSDYDSWRGSRSLNGDNVEKTAKMFVGIPYLWGGTSAKGMDCSGFTKTVYRLNGMELSRDADQQAAMGTDVQVDANFSGLKKGDLLFFGRKGTADRPERISHVAIYLENKLYIESSGRVRFGSFDPSSPYFREYNARRFVRVRRIIPSGDIPEVKQ